MASTTQKTFKPLTNKDISYLNRDFSQFKKNLIEYTKTYFPKNYQDFSDSSPGTIFIDMAAYVGDVLSFYLDQQFKESLFPYTEERKNVLALSKFLGYKPKVSRPSLTNFDVYQLVPSVKNDVGEYIPDEKYTLRIKSGMQLINSAGIAFVTTDVIDFSMDTVNSPREITVSSRDEYGIPQFFLIKKTANGISGQIVTKTFIVNENTPYYKLYLDEPNVLEILDVRDQDNVPWYEVEYLAQDIVLTSYENVSLNDDRFIQIQQLIDAKKEMLINKQKKLRFIVKQNRFLDAVKNDYHKIYSYIEQQKMDQIRALEILDEYIKDLTLSGKLTKHNIEDAKEEQVKILTEVKSIKNSLDSIINNTEELTNKSKNKKFTL
jgi:hypothetical protein